ncbi:MAG: NAD(P)-dependent oxidoreductase [Tannerellaceae bacterium]|jgi:nucleoside-diphosphate-sugar epimerase|nr:NAD(P)-dependent oxidoreductase [Tannerellaceae bacterium]
MKKILITGAGGFIGGFLVAEALAAGYETWAGIRASSNRERLQDKRIRFIDLNYAHPDVFTAQIAAFAAAHGRWDYVIHNAGLTKTVNKSDFFRVNALYTRNLVDALAKAQCLPQKFLLMSSLSSYGKGDEQTLAPIREGDAQTPDSAYGKSKLEAECIVRRQTYFPYVILRPTGVYGPGEKDYFMEIKSIRSGFDFTAGMRLQNISFVYVKDLAHAVLMAAANETIANVAYFVSDGRKYTDAGFAALIQEILGRKRLLRIRIPMPLVFLACLCSEVVGKIKGRSMTLNLDKFMILRGRNWTCDAAPLWRDLGAEPAYDLRRGLEESVEWYRREGWL